MTHESLIIDSIWRAAIFSLAITNCTRAVAPKSKISVRKFVDEIPSRDENDLFLTRKMTRFSGLYDSPSDVGVKLTTALARGREEAGFRDYDWLWVARSEGAQRPMGVVS